MAITALLSGKVTLKESAISPYVCFGNWKEIAIIFVALLIGSLSVKIDIFLIVTIIQNLVPGFNTGTPRLLSFDRTKNDTFGRNKTFIKHGEESSSKRVKRGTGDAGWDYSAYNYEDFRKEFYAENPVETNYKDDNTTSHSGTKRSPSFTTPKRPTIIVTMENYCSVFLYVRIRVFSCLRHAVVNGEYELMHRCTNVLIVWIIIYVLLATYFWCTNGWCCCCFFWVWWCRPFRVMQNAKHILATQPPGVDIEGGLRVNYEPTADEKKCYSTLEEIVFY